MIRAMMIFAPLAVLNLLGAAPALPGWALNFGALGLCGYLVWRAEIRQSRLVGIVELQQAQLEEKNERVVLLVQENTKSNHRLAEALETRPCLHGDRVFQKEEGG